MTELVLSGLAMGESPRWHDGRLWLSDWGAGELLVVEDGRAEVVARVDALPFCFDWRDDALLVVGGGALSRVEDGGLAREVDLNPLAATPWNEIAVDARGNVFVNNIGFEYGEGEPAPGSIAVVTPDGEARLVADGVMFPNGMRVVGDTLIVAESFANRLTAFAVAPDGSLSDRRIFAELSHAPDGIWVDAAGAVWSASVPGKHCVRVAEGGEELDRVELDQGAFACALGGDDGRTLFIVCADWPAAMEPGTRTGRVLSSRVAVPSLDV